MLSSLDIKTIFTNDFLKLKEKVEHRFYTTAISFAQDFSEVFRHGINTDPPLSESVVAKELEKSAPVKKTMMDIRERRRLAKRIIKVVQPQLEMAAKAEADIDDKPVEMTVKAVEQLLEAGLVIGPDPVSAPSGNAGSHENINMDHDLDIEMAEANDAHQMNGRIDLQADLEQERRFVTADVEMQDVDADGEHEDDVEESIVITLPAVSEVDAALSQSKSEQVNGAKNTATPPDSTGYVSAPESIQPAPQTPPISNGDTTNENAEILRHGGVFLYLKDFNPVGTSIVPGDENASVVSDELSVMDDEELRGLGGEIGEMGIAFAAPVVPAVTPGKAKKAKAKKRSKGRR